MQENNKINIENMFEGKDINVFLDGNRIEESLIKKFVLDENINEHSVLNIEIEIDAAQKNKFENILGKEKTEIKIELTKSDSRRKIFDGIVDYFEILNYGSQGYCIILKGFSKSIAFDRKEEKKYRVFQDTDWTYANIIDEINKEYREEKLEIKYSGKAGESIRKILIQYDETDWEFLVRLASYLQTGLMITEQGVIIFGIIETSEVKKENKYFSSYSTVRDYRNFYYKVHSGKTISLGDSVNIGLGNDEKSSGREKFTVLKSKIYLENYVLKSEFLASKMDSYIIPRKYNPKIRGSAVEVKVEKVLENENIAKMEVSFSEGLRKTVQKKNEDSMNRHSSYNDYGIKKYPLSYQTFYSKTNTGFFCTPEVNDVVEAYFPDEDESSAKISWAVNNENSGRFSDYTKRNFHINGNDFSFNIDRNIVDVNIAKSYTRNSKTSTVNAESVVEKAVKNMVIVSDDYVGIESIGEMSIYGNSIDIVGKEKDIKIETPSEIRIKGSKVHNN